MNPAKDILSTLAAPSADIVAFAARKVV